jgi:RimJ/RimL family protein N-acetyltransferase
MKHPILRDFPDSFETARLLIRSPRPGDGPEVTTAIRESWDALHEWMPWAREQPTVEQTEERLRRAHCAFQERTDLMLLLFQKGTQTLVGSSGLHRMDWTVPRFEIGYWCRTRFEGQGYISEAVRGITRFAFETLDAQRVEIRCDSHNLRSRRVAERAGYQLEGELRNQGIGREGQLRNIQVFSLIPEEYEALQATWTSAAHSLRGTPIQYLEPTEPVAQQDWEVLDDPGRE